MILIMLDTEVWFMNGLKIEQGIFRGIQNDRAIIEPFYSTGLRYIPVQDRYHLWDFEESEFLEMRLKSNIEGDSA